jgi:hypothetical protein
VFGSSDLYLILILARQLRLAFRDLSPCFSDDGGRNFNIFFRGFRGYTGFRPLQPLFVSTPNDLPVSKYSLHKVRVKVCSKDPK